MESAAARFVYVGHRLNTSVGWGNYNVCSCLTRLSDVARPLDAVQLYLVEGVGDGVANPSHQSVLDPNDHTITARSYGYSGIRKFMFNVWFTYTPAVYQGQHGVLGRVLGGWTFAPILDMGSGLPVGVYTGQWASSAYTGGQSFGGMDSSNIGDYENAVNMCGGRTFTTTRHDNFSQGMGLWRQRFLNLFPGSGSGLFLLPQAIMASTGHNGGLSVYRGMPFWNVDMNIQEGAVRITGRIGAEFGAVFTNVFNHNQLADPGQTYLTPSPTGTLRLEPSKGAPAFCRLITHGR